MSRRSDCSMSCSVASLSLSLYIYIYRERYVVTYIYIYMYIHSPASDTARMSTGRYVCSHHLSYSNLRVLFNIVLFTMYISKVSSQSTAPHDIGQPRAPLAKAMITIISITISNHNINSIHNNNKTWPECLRGAVPYRRRRQGEGDWGIVRIYIYDNIYIYICICIYIYIYIIERYTCIYIYIYIYSILLV